MAAATLDAVPTADGPMPAHLWLPEGPGPHPGLVVFQEIFGVSDYIKKRCADLAELGYVVLAPEIYWRLDDAEIDESAPDFLDRAVGLVGQLDWEQAVADGVATLDALRSREDVMEGGVLGFCFGGGLAFNVAAAAPAPPALLVSYYGSALPGLVQSGMASRVTCPSLHHFGTLDTYIPREQVEVIRDAVTAGGTRDEVTFELHEGAGHAFDNPHPMFHHAQAAETAWAQTTAWLREHLPA